MVLGAGLTAWGQLTGGRSAPAPAVLGQDAPDSCLRGPVKYTELSSSSWGGVEGCEQVSFPTPSSSLRAHWVLTLRWQSFTFVGLMLTLASLGGEDEA